MRVLVTGSAGYIGSHVVKELEARGHEVRRFDLADGQDIHNREQLVEAAAGCEVVAHLAAIPFPKKGKPWSEYYRVNVAGTQAVFEASDGRVVLASSSAYYGAHREFPFTPDDMTPTGPNAIQRYYGKPLPDSPYGRAALAYALSKVGAETVAAAYGLAGRGVSVLRFHPSPHTRKPYEWGLFMAPETAAAAVADAVSESGFVIRDVSG